MEKLLEARLFGRVQGILYRAFIRRAGRSYGLVGTVRNLDDGSVEVIAEGEESKLREFLHTIQTGYRFAHLENIEEKWGDPAGTFSNFRIL